MEDDTPKDSSSLVLAVVAMVLVIVGGGWLYLSFGKPDPTPVVSTAITPPEPLDVPEEIDPRFDLQQNLDMGQLALDAGQLVEPADGSALYFFLSALEQDAENVSAQIGLERISDLMSGRADAQLAAEQYIDLDGSLRVLERIDAADPNLLRLREEIATLVQTRLATVDAAITRQQWAPAQALLDQLATVPGVDGLLIVERTDALQTAQAAAQAAAAVRAQAVADAALAAEDTATPDEESDEAEDEQDSDASAEDEGTGPDVDALFATVVQRLNAGNLIEPTGASARDALGDLSLAAPDNTLVVTARGRLIGALADRAVGLSATGDFGQADRLLDVAATIDASNPRIPATREAVLERRVTLESERIIPVGELVNTRVVQPRYPQRALRNEIEGYVVLNFTVAPDGTTGDIEVVDASRRYADQFQRAAISAADQWEFEPRQYLGRQIAQRVQARVTFELSD